MRVLHLLSQRPGLSGSGVFFNALIREAAKAGLVQHAITAGPLGTSHLDVPPLTKDQFTLVPFPSRQAPFPVPGNSDIMPYPSSVFRQMSELQLDQYTNACHQVLADVRSRFSPDIVHSHHLWILTALARRVFADVPVIATAHNSELRQLVKVPHLSDRVLPEIQDLDAIGVLTPQSKQDTRGAFKVEAHRITVTGAGFREDLFFNPTTPVSTIVDHLGKSFNIHLALPSITGKRSQIVTFAGRLSSPKGVYYLLEAFQQLQAESETPRKLLLLGGSGSGKDGVHLERAVNRAGVDVVFLGAIPQPAVALILQLSDVFVLPSLYEGLPLVMLEAAACGCPCVISKLPTIASWVPLHWQEAGGGITFIRPLATRAADEPILTDEERYVRDLKGALKSVLTDTWDADRRRQFAEELKPHSWANVFLRYRKLYEIAIEKRRGI